jgi:hypothetical protein
MRGVALWCQWRTVVAPAILGALATGCVSFSDGPARLYTVPEETQLIRDNIQQINLIQYSSLDEASRQRVRNDWIGARMYAIDIQYTPYEAALTKERQGVGFGAATTTIALTTASGLIAPVATKNLLTGLAGLVTGARAAYDSDILLSHSVQWIQSQMEAKRSEISSRILKGMKLSTIDYPLAAALSDLEAYYRAGTFTGGLLSTNEIVAADARNAAMEKAASQGLLDPAVVVQQAIIPDVRKPLQSGGFRPKEVDPDKLFFNQVDAALCVRQTGQSRDLAIRDFLAGQRQLKDPTVSSVTITTKFRVRLDRAREQVPSCEKAGYLNAFEVGRYGVFAPSVAPGVRSADINALQRALKVAETGNLDDPTRKAIAAARVQGNIKPTLGGQIDIEFLSKVFE